jgi:pSer/pThr/pTyr-binding forkhead associated (FHA) protein
MSQILDDPPVLIAQVGPLESQQFSVQGTIMIGRDSNADIVILTPDKQVSRLHASIKATKKNVILSDLGSKNGTYINGERIQKPEILNDGDMIQIALAQKFVFFYSDSTVALDGIGLHRVSNKKLRLDDRSKMVYLKDIEVDPPLSAAQFNLLQKLYDNEDEVVSRYDLVKAIWGDENAYGVSDQALDALDRRDRSRLAEIDPENLIITVRGHGLRLKNPDKE